MDQVDLSKFYSGGYFLVLAENPGMPPGWGHFEPDLVPEMVISLSGCMLLVVDAAWELFPLNDLKVLDLGESLEKKDALHEWCKPDNALGYDPQSCLFYEPAAARRFADQFLPNRDKLFLIGVGLPHHLQIEHWPEPKDGKMAGTEKRIRAQLAMESGGEPLGFEVLSFGNGYLGHSWLCSSLHTRMNELFGILPNRYGLINSQSDAQKVYDWVAEDNMQGHRGEPEPYDYWLLASYPL